MRNDLQSLDPDWAWSPYQPDDPQQGWNRRLAAHLFRRTGFGASYGELLAAEQEAPADVVRRLVSETRETPQQRQLYQTMAATILGTGNAENLTAWWLYRLIDSPAQLPEKMTVFWHGHFATGAEKVQDAKLMFRQNELLRKHALGRFGEMVQEISQDPAMLIYLDSVTNRKAHPNENYAREVMELFCLGEGNYSEQDVQELARCFTGWEIRNEKFRFNAYQHDGGEKTILGQTGKFGGEQGIDIILDQPACPKFIVRKLIRYFLFDEPEVPDALIEPLARDFQASGYEINPLLERLLGSNLFFSPYSVGRKIRSPIEFAVGLLRGLETRADMYALRDELVHLGQVLFYPPNVKGWDGGRTWINSSTLLARANLVRSFVEQQKGRFAPGALRQLAESYGQTTPEQIVDWLCDLLLAVPIPSTARDQLVALASAGGRRSPALGEVVHALCTLPEFQLA